LRLTWAKALFAGALVLIGLGVYSRWTALGLEVEAGQAAERSREAASAFASSMRSADHYSELKLLDQRRERTLLAAKYGRWGLFAFGAAVLLILASWLSHEIRLFRELAQEVEEGQRQRGENRPGNGPGGPDTPG
jgi:predicted Co/Zn/Cd cation transporter (cation efflux family)